MLLGVRAVIAESFERIHRSNLIGMGILPLQYPAGQNARDARTHRRRDVRDHRHRRRRSSAHDASRSPRPAPTARRSVRCDACASIRPTKPTTTATAASCSTCCGKSRRGRSSADGASRARVAILSFEGPDRYASIGGLGTRVSHLARALGAAGVTTDLIFVGDPHTAPVEDFGAERHAAALVAVDLGASSAQRLRRRSGKDRDWEASVPGFVVDAIVAPAAARGRTRRS